MKVFDEVIGKEVYVQEEITPDIGVELKLNEIKPEIDVEVEDDDDE